MIASSIVEWCQYTFEVMLGLAPLSRRRSTILMLPRSEAHISAVHPCYEQSTIKLNSFTNRKDDKQKTILDLHQVHTSSDSLASIGMVGSLSFWRMFLTVLRSLFLTASIRSYVNIKMTQSHNSLKYDPGQFNFISLFQIRQLWSL
jgi:hypothetical protein